MELLSSALLPLHFLVSFTFLPLTSHPQFKSKFPISFISFFSFSQDPKNIFDMFLFWFLFLFGDAAGPLLDPASSSMRTHNAQSSLTA